MATKTTSVNKKKCVKCGKMFLLSQGKMVLRGINFVCNSCLKKEQKKNQGAEVCEFC